MYQQWIATNASSLLAVAISGTVVYLGIILYCRLFGLRSFSKISPSDFAMTLAVGSLFGSTISSPNPTLFLGLFALAWLFLGQWVVALLRKRVPGLMQWTDAQPLLLMEGPEIIAENLRQANVTRADLIAKLREANVTDFSQVLAVVFETNGDISVLHASDPDAVLSDDLLHGVGPGAARRPEKQNAR